MANRITFNHCLRLATALSLLSAVMVSPILSFRAAASYRSNYLRRNFGIPKADSHSRPASPVASRILQVKALHCEAENDLNWTTCSVFHFVEPPDLPSVGSEPEPGISCFGRAIHPLRC